MKNVTASHENVTASHKNFTASRKNATASHENVTASHENVTASQPPYLLILIGFSRQLYILNTYRDSFRFHYPVARAREEVY